MTDGAGRSDAVVDLPALCRRSWPLRALYAATGRTIEHTLKFDLLNAEVRRWEQLCGSAPTFAAAVEGLPIEPRPQGPGVRTAAAHGPLLVVSNHPLGGVETIVLGWFLEALRPDLKILGTRLLLRMRPLAPYLIPVDSFGRWTPTAENLAPLRQALGHLRGGGALLVFPAGRVSHFRWSKLRVTDPPWTTHAVRLARASSAATLPVYFPGKNSLTFHAAGFVHPLLRTLLLAREFFRHVRQQQVPFTLGEPILPQQLGQFEDDRQAIVWLRRTVYQLGDGLSSADSREAAS